MRLIIPPLMYYLIRLAKHLSTPRITKPIKHPALNTHFVALA